MTIFRRNMSHPAHVLATILVLTLAATALAAPATSTASALNLTIQGRPEHPTVYLTKEDVAAARRNHERYAWAKAAADALLRDADAWANKSDPDLRAMIPQPGACFAYGFSSCPICKDKLAGWWGENGMASFDDPGHIKCPNGHRLPDADHPDPGTGWTDADGKKFYFVGTYNSFLIQRLSDASINLANAYALTGDEKYAQKSALLLDELARIYPTCDKGSWDYPSDPPSGRFNRPWYQVARMLVHYTHAYDVLLMGAALNTPSSVAGLTKRQNVERNMLLNGAQYCYDRSVEHPALHNGQADYLRGCTVVGVAMGIPELVAWGVDGPYGILNMVENNIDRDGQYYETSAGYSHHARYLYVNTAEILKNYKDAAHPDGIRLARHPKFRAFCLLPAARLETLGTLPRLGDDAPISGPIKPPATEHADDVMDLEHLAALDPQSDAPALLQKLAGGKLDEARVAMTVTKGNNSGAVQSHANFLLFHAVEVAPTSPQSTINNQHLTHPLTNSPLDTSDLITQRGLAILRSGDHTAVTLRAGPTLNHGNFDELNLGVYARGNDLTYDLGYSLGSSHVYVGWSKQTASHNTVLVDETSQLKSGLAGGTIKAFSAAPGFQFVRADDPACYAASNVTQYDRTVMLVDAPGAGGGAYLFDTFRVAGGKQHDYPFHSRGAQLALEGVTVGEPSAGSLAGKEHAYGNSIGPDGDIIGIPNKPYFNAPPGNGLGFLMSPRRATTTPTSVWSADWTVTDDAHLRVTMLPTTKVEVVTADAPGIYPSLPRAGYVFSRRASNSSTFASVVEPYGKTRVVREVTPLLPAMEDATSPIAAKIALADDTTDYVLQSDAKPIECADGPTKIAASPGTARIRVAGGHVTAVDVVSAQTLTFGDLTVTLDRAEHVGKITRIDYDNPTIYTDTPLPEGDALAGQFLYVRSGRADAPYSQDSAYRIASVTRDGATTAIHLTPTSFLLARGHLDSAPSGDTFPNVVPIEYAKSLAHKPSGFFRNKRITTRDGRAAASVVEIAGTGMPIKVNQTAGFKPGDDLLIYDAIEGDTFRIPATAHLRRNPDGTWTARATTALKVALNGKQIDPAKQ